MLVAGAVRLKTPCRAETSSGIVKFWHCLASLNAASAVSAIAEVVSFIFSRDLVSEE
jgi:hypothetical protein